MKSNKTGTATHGHGLVPKISKHEVNLPKNGFLRFQVGLLFALILVYVMLQLSFRASAVVPPEEVTLPEELVEFTLGEVTPEKKPDPKKLQPVPVTKVVDPEEFKVVDDVSEVVESETASSEVTDEELRVEDIPEVVPDPDPVHVNAVEFAPVFPGCDVSMSNRERIDCMNEQMNRYIQRYFDIGIASDYGLYGKQRISLQFTIDASGLITDVKVKAPHPALEQEVKDLVKRFPPMEPGMQGAKPVKVVFMKPIIFKVE